MSQQRSELPRCDDAAALASTTTTSASQFPEISEQVRREQRLKRAANPCGERTFTINRPVEHRSAIHLLHQASELAAVAGFQLARGDGVIQQLLGFLAHGQELLEKHRAEFRIAQINLQVSQKVRHRLGRRGKSTELDE